MSRNDARAAVARTDALSLLPERSVMAHPAPSAYGRFLVFSARAGADREGQQRVETGLLIGF